MRILYSSHMRSRQSNSATGRLAGLCERLRLVNPPADVLRRLEARVWNAQRVEDMGRDAAALGLPRISLSELPAVADQH
jgi:hypothetical protein